MSCAETSNGKTSTSCALVSSTPCIYTFFFFFYTFQRIKTFCLTYATNIFTADVNFEEKKKKLIKLVRRSSRLWPVHADTDGRLMDRKRIRCIRFQFPAALVFTAVVGEKKNHRLDFREITPRILFFFFFVFFPHLCFFFPRRRRVVWLTKPAESTAPTNDLVVPFYTRRPSVTRLGLFIA